MKVQGYCLIVLMGISATSLAQDKDAFVIATAGDRSASNQIVLEWTVGESAIESVSSSSVLLTQGFHQTFLKVKQLTVSNDIGPLQHLVQVFPNPSTAYVNIRLTNPAEASLLLSLLDITGRVLLSERVRNSNMAARLDLSSLSQGTYLLRVTDLGGTVQGSYKIIKMR